jgi:phytoene desaturase
MPKKVIIIGAGVGGLATATLLAKQGYAVTVYEKSAHIGGKAGILKAKGFTFDTGPSWYLMPRVFEHYYQLLGSTTATEYELIKLTPAYKVFFESGSPLTITGDEQSDCSTFDSLEPGSGAKLARYIKESNRIYDLSLQYFLYTNFDHLRDILRPVVLRNSLTLLRLALTPLHRYVSRYVQHPRLQQILEYPTVFLGASPFATPALYSLMSTLDFREGVYYPKGGMYKIVESLTKHAERLGVVIQANSPVEAILTTGKHISGVKLQNGKTIAADVVISNADIHYTETVLLPPAARSYSDRYWQRQQMGMSAVLLYLGIKGRLDNLGHHNLLFTKDWKANFDAIYKHGIFPEPASMYISRTSATDDTAPMDHENLFVLIPLPAGKIPDAAEQARLVQSYLDQMQTMTGVADLQERIVYQKVFGPKDFTDTFHAYRASALGQSHILTQSALFRTANKSKKLDNLYYVGAGTTPGIGLPMCLISAENVCRRIQGDI